MAQPVKTVDDLQVEQFYTDREGKVWPEETWITEDGRKILVKDLEPEHAKNILRMIMRTEREMSLEYDTMMNALETVFAQAEREQSGALLN